MVPQRNPAPGAAILSDASAGPYRSSRRRYIHSTLLQRSMNVKCALSEEQN